jgi:hypothetical protein
MSNEANIQLLQESLEALNARDTDRFMATIHEEVTCNKGNKGRGRNEVRDPKRPSRTTHTPFVFRLTWSDSPQPLASAP